MAAVKRLFKWNYKKMQKYLETSFTKSQKKTLNAAGPLVICWSKDLSNKKKQPLPFVEGPFQRCWAESQFQNTPIAGQNPQASKMNKYFRNTYLAVIKSF